jgi:hypothetical protein
MGISFIDEQITGFNLEKSHKLSWVSESKTKIETVKFAFNLSEHDKTIS